MTMRENINIFNMTYFPSSSVPQMITEIQILEDAMPKLAALVDLHRFYILTLDVKEIRWFPSSYFDVQNKLKPPDEPRPKENYSF